MEEPPLLAVYQLIVPPAQPVAVSVTEPISQRLALVGVGAPGAGLTVATAGTLLEAHGPSIQLA